MIAHPYVRGGLLLIAHNQLQLLNNEGGRPHGPPVPGSDMNLLTDKKNN